MRFPLLLSLALAPFLTGCLAPRNAAVTAQREGTQVVFQSAGRELFRYQAEPGELPRPDIRESFRRGGYIHPLRSPSGLMLTDDFPPDHVHHHGIWAPWTKTRFEGREPDFWNMGANKGRVEFVAVDKVWNERGAAGLTARHRFVDLLAPGGPKTVLHETWTLRARTIQSPVTADVIDLVGVQTCATDSPLDLPKYHYGGMGFRGNRAWTGANNGQFLTSNGDTDRLKINQTRGKWCWMGGPVDGRVAGVVILCHPDNYRFPQPMRLHPSEPFLCFAPQQLGDMAIRPGQPYVYRFRYVTLDGPPDAALFDRLWATYAAEKTE